MKKLWIVAAILAVALLVSLGILFHPPLEVNGSKASFGTKAAAIQSINEEISSRTISIGDEVYRYDALGVSVDQNALEKALEGKFLFLPGAWNAVETVPYVVDGDLLNAALESNTNVFSPTVTSVSKGATQFIVTPGKPGNTVTAESLVEAVTEGAPEVDLEEVSPVDDTMLLEEVDSLNKILENGIAVLVDDEEVGRLTANQLIAAYSVEVREDLRSATLDAETMGTVQSGGESFDATETVLTLETFIDADSLVSTVSEMASSSPVNGVAVTNKNGDKLYALEEWSSGFNVDSSQVEEAINSALVDGQPLVVPGEVVEPVITEKFREVVVSISDRRAYFYENGDLVKSVPVAVGKPGWETSVGEFAVYTQLAKQDMGCSRPDLPYCTKDVPWISYFNGDQGLHGAYWHNDFGNPSSSAVSAGCVNMPVEDAKWAYDFVTVGTPVTVKP